MFTVIMFYSDCVWLIMYGKRKGISRFPPARMLIFKLFILAE